MGLKPERFVFKWLKNGSDSREMNVNGSVTPVDFRYTAPVQSTEIERVLIMVMDVGMAPDEFGGLGALLTNGISIKVFDSDDTELLDFLDGATIKSNEDWAHLAGTDVLLNNSAQNDMQPIRWTIAKAGARLQLESGQYLQFKVQDDLTGLTEFRAMVQGVLLS